MKKLTIDWGELELAFDNSDPMFEHFLDNETGQVLMMTEEFSQELEEVYEQFYDPEDEEAFDLAAVLPQTKLKDWQQQGVMEAYQIEAGFGSRYLRIPTRDSHDAYNVMCDFIITLDDEQLADSLRNAISGRGAFRYFKDVLHQHPAQEKRWFAYRDKRFQEEMVEWLEEEGIKPLNEPVTRIESESELPQFRQRLLEEVIWFTKQAGKIPGVTRIALIGSLTTDKRDPKDADVLVTITEEVNLEQLAAIARKFSGHAQNFGHGADVFLADPQGYYLGRTCPWKQCGPFIRASCDALNCGQRQYLHDDLETIRLSDELIAAPPLELWPQVVSRIALPVDLAEVTQHLKE